jgi:hypothetical protein
MSSLFSDLAEKFGRSPENLATEGLRHLLRRRVAADAFVEYVNAQSGVDLSSDLLFRTQEGTEEGEGQADMKGVAGDGSAPLLVESKFWAGLTANQPNGYLRHLQDLPGGVLLFVVPHPRRQYLWPKIREQARTEFPTNEEEGTAQDEFRLSLQNGTTLLLRSWKDVLDAIESPVQAEGGHSDLLEDLRQVRGLCDRYSDAGFLPLRGEEIGQNIGKRIQQLHGIVRDLRGHLDEEWKTDAQMSPSQDRYAFTAELYGYDVALGLKYYWWAEKGISPMWLRVKTKNKDQRDEVYRSAEPDIQAFKDYPSSYPHDVLFPLPLQLGVERPEVMTGLVNQLNKIAQRLKPVLSDG